MKIFNLNPSVDKWLLFNTSFMDSGVGRASKSFTFVSGKGLNVGRALQTLDFSDYEVINIVGGALGNVISQVAKKEGLQCDFFQITGDSRVNTIAIYEDNSLSPQVFNDIGPLMEEGEVRLFMNYLKKKIKKHDQVILSGSSLASVGNQLFLKTVSELKEKKCTIQADIVGENLKCIIENLQGQIQLIKINNFEFEDYFGVSPRDKKAIKSIMHEMDIKEFIITLGADGVLYYSRELCFEGVYSEIIRGNPVGSGDSFFAGWLYAENRNMGVIKQLQIAMACGAANLLGFGPAVFSYSDVIKIQDKIIIERV